MKLKKLSCSKISIFFYVIAILALIAFGLSYYNVTVYLMSLVEAGQISWTENFFDVLVYYISNGFTYFVYAVILFGVGYMISLLKSFQKSKTHEENEMTDQIEEVVSKE